MKVFSLYQLIFSLKIFLLAIHLTIKLKKQKQLNLQILPKIRYNNYLAVSLKNRMQLIFQNTKQLKEVRQFIKGLGYVYDSINKKQKEIYLFISGSYIAIVNNFINTQVPDYKVCFCKLKRNMYKLRNFFNGNETLQNEGIIFFLDVQLILKLLNTQVQSDINQMTITFPPLDAQGKRQYEMDLTYQSDGMKGIFKLFTRLQHSSWPFQDGTIGQSCIQNSIMIKFLTFPSKFVKQIQYYKKYSQFWICLNPDGVNIKRTEGSYVVSDQTIKGEEFGQYDYYGLNQSLKGNSFLNISSDYFFHHLQQSNKQNRKTQARILIEQEYNQQENMMKKFYLCLTTVTEKREIHEFFEISARSSINYKEVSREVQRLKLRLKDPKKQEEEDDERLVLNRFYGPEYEETMRLDMVNRETVSRVPEPKGQETVTNMRKTKVQI